MKSALRKTLLSLMTLLLMIGVANVGIVKADLILYLSFDEGSGNKVKDSAQGYTSSLEGDTNWIEGKVNKALEFKGNAKVEIDRTDVLEPKTEITIATWMKLNDNTGNHEIVRKQIPNGKGYDIRLQGGKIHWWVNVGGWQNSNSPKNLPVNEWMFLSTTYDGSKSRIYLNGEEIASNDIAGKIIYDESNLLIGSAAPHDPNYNLNGALDEFMMWNKTMSPAEIEAAIKDISPVELKEKLPVLWGVLKR